jgi:hypothetical protein
MKNKSKHYYDTEAEIEKNHPEIKALQDVDDAISDIIDAQETEKEKIYEVEVTETKRVMKKFNGNDLPLYFQWHGGIKTWLYKVYILDGKIKADKLVYSIKDKEIEYTSVAVESAFKEDHVEVDACVWNEGLQLIYKNAGNDK